MLTGATRKQATLPMSTRWLLQVTPTKSKEPVKSILISTSKGMAIRVIIARSKRSPIRTSRRATSRRTSEKMRRLTIVAAVHWTTKVRPTKSLPIVVELIPALDVINSGLRNGHCEDSSCCSLSEIRAFNLCFFTGSALIRRRLSSPRPVQLQLLRL